MASMLTLPNQTEVTICQRWIVPPPHEEDYIENELESLIPVSEAVKKIRENLLLTTCVMGYFQKIQGEGLTFVIMHLAYFTTRTHYIEDHLRVYYYDVWESKKQFKLCKKHTQDIPRYIITDNGKPFDNKLMKKNCDLFGFKQRKSSMYHATANGLAEAFNKTLCNLLKKVVSKSKWDCHERMEEALWAYRTIYRTPTQTTPYSLAFGVEAVLPLERQISFLRLAIQEGLTEEENARLRLVELETLDEKRLEAQQNLECYQAHLSRAFNKKVRLRCFQVGDQVLAVIRPIITSHKSGGKFTS
ncbi:uncharacterized protein [Solanum tuberosum]|uniref:uncharacterized protein n=1 Tax=Solanum tuberosum TaxID=4113 RepID=UPI00073A00A5|nr:PREDICTED: uncharacterized protein LOC107062657 [Solanum tuberosum]